MIRQQNGSGKNGVKLLGLVGKPPVLLLKCFIRNIYLTTIWGMLRFDSGSLNVYPICSYVWSYNKLPTVGWRIVVFSSVCTCTAAFVFSFSGVCIEIATFVFSGIFLWYFWRYVLTYRWIIVTDCYTLYRFACRRKCFHNRLCIILRRWRTSLWMRFFFIGR